MQDDKSFDISICWSTPVDLDLCVFYRCPGGDVGGVFSDEFRSNPDDLGRLDAFPYMRHKGDIKEPAAGGAGHETVTVARPDRFERLDVVVINYDDAIDLLDVDYADSRGYCVVGDRRIESRPTGRGQAYHVATVCRDESGCLVAEPVNKVITLREAYDSIPGFALICE